MLYSPSIHHHTPKITKSNSGRRRLLVRDDDLSLGDAALCSQGPSRRRQDPRHHRVSTEPTWRTCTKDGPNATDGRRQGACRQRWKKIAHGGRGCVEISYGKDMSEVDGVDETKRHSRTGQVGVQNKNEIKHH